VAARAEDAADDIELSGTSLPLVGTTDMLDEAFKNIGNVTQCNWQECAANDTPHQFRNVPRLGHGGCEVPLWCA
jgi:hypothetical protein